MAPGWRQQDCSMVGEESTGRFRNVRRGHVAVKRGPLLEEGVVGMSTTFSAPAALSRILGSVFPAGLTLRRVGLWRRWDGG